MAQIQITIQDVIAGSKTAKQISFIGQLDETNVDDEAKKVYAVIDEESEPNLLLDFSGLEYMNSKSIGYVTDWYSRVTAKNGKVVIAQPPPNILDILKVVGITQIVPILDTIDAAKAALAQGADSATSNEPAISVPPEQPANTTDESAS